MKGLILYNGYSHIPQYEHQISRFIEEFASAGVDVEAVPNNRFAFHIDDGAPVSDIGFDFCLYLDKDDYTSRMIERMGIPVFNSPQSITDCDDKMSTYILLSGNGIGMPDTTPGPLFYDPGMDVDDASVDVLEQRYGYPMVVKESFGSSGNGVYLVHDRDELKGRMTALRGRKYLVQRFIDTSIGEDLRVIVIGGKAIGGMIRHSDSDFRSNAVLGGRTIQYDVPEVSRVISEKVSNLLGLDYCGIDLLRDGSGEYSIVCEVNSNAFFSAFEESTGINVAGAYVRHILSVLENRAGRGLCDKNINNQVQSPPGDSIGS